jgi:membrane protein YqaA with SNARE-associated domain
MFVLSFAECSFFPIPPDPLLIALCIVEPKKTMQFAIFKYVLH